MSLFPELFRQNQSSPFRDLARVQRELDRAFESWFERPAALKTGDVTGVASWTPPCEIYETESGYELSAELPGVRKEDIKVDIEDNRVSFSAEKKSEKRDARTHVSEFSYGTFSRSFTLPQEINLERSGASFENGVLKINLTKATESAPKARTLTVK